jgi:hypothetical protein
MTTTCEPKIICTTCAAQLPASEFRRRSRESEARMTKCRRCHAGYERVRRQKIQRKQNGQALQKAATQITRYRSIDRTENLIDLMVSRFGGVAEFFDFWTAEIQRVQTQKRTTFRILRFCEMILSAHLADSEESTFKVEESRAAALQAIRRLFQERADIMEAAAQQVGATIVWADGLEAASA